MFRVTCVCTVVPLFAFIISLLWDTESWFLVYVALNKIKHSSNISLMFVQFLYFSENISRTLFCYCCQQFTKFQLNLEGPAKLRKKSLHEISWIIKNWEHLHLAWKHWWKAWKLWKNDICIRILNIWLLIFK